MAMATEHSHMLGILVLLISLLALTKPSMADDIPMNFSRSYFPDGFVFGVSTSAYQIEGEANERGRGPSVWDVFTHESPERIMDGSNGDAGVDFYNTFKADIKRMKLNGIDAYRFSISWSRIIPSLEPFVTIFHWDTPQALEDKYGGFLSSDIVDDFHDYADFLFEKFGDRVKYWMTLNEPWAVTGLAYDEGIHAPGRCSFWVNRQCSAGNSATEPYIVAHHLLLSHAAAVQTFREKYQKIQKGKIGITLFTFWYEPISNKTVDKEAAKTALDFMFGLFMDPITYGQYPRRVQTLVGDRLPTFTDVESQLLRGSYDFVGLQYYTSYYAKANATIDPNHIRYKTDSQVTQTAYDDDGQPIGPQAYSPWLYIYPKGIRHILNYTKDTYNNPVIYITENGVDEYNNKSKTWEQGTNDQHRIDYLKAHMWNVLGSIKDYNVNVKGYFALSFLDKFEWNMGYSSRFGLHYVDYKNNMTRHPKNSATWFCLFLKNWPMGSRCPVNSYNIAYN
ncbi:hypothetical protein GH714_015417 [Hevea brasiliensis]|uniref:Beta-glucosidase n=1 Tax=Hevea brasiliensis TaxID=3981 RepID=A0A6A6N1U7_HEVBR|nr:hypothetical protein GH714_015417 [Hevea brasiliensis]